MKITQLRAPAILFAALAASIPRTSNADPGRTFAVTSPPVALPLVLSRAGVTSRARLDLPAVGDTIVLGASRRLVFLANGLVPAVLETERASLPVTVAFDEASTTAGVDAKAHLVRTLHVRDQDGAELAALAITSDLDVYGLADERPHVKLEASSARAAGAFGGVLAGAELSHDVPIATPAFPLELLATGTQLSVSAHDGALTGQLLLEQRFSPGAVQGEAATRVALQLFDDHGRHCGDLVTHVAARPGDPDRWEASVAGAPRAAITWSKVGGRWTGALRIDASGTAPACAPARALVTLGDSTSPFVVQASGAVVAAAEKLAGAATKASVRLEP